MTQMCEPRGRIGFQLKVLGLAGLSLCMLAGVTMPVQAQTSIDALGAPEGATEGATDATAIPSAQDLLPAADPAFESAPEPATPEFMPESIEPIPAEVAQPDLPARSVDLELFSPGADALTPDSTAGSPLVTPNLVDQAEAAFGQGAAGNLIDSSTSYSLGATDNPSVILAERSTGCETVMQLGQSTPDSVCSFMGVGMGATPFYDGMNLAGGEMNLSVVYGGRTTPSASDYYNLTIRPPARLSIGKVNLLFPLSIPAAITSAFGWRIHPVMGSSRFHAGTDLGAPQGTPVVAAFSGKVAIADFMGGYGLAVVVRHQNDTEESLYGHLSEIFVKPGETVKQGEVIGRVGSTGLSTGPHLHFEFRKQTPSGWIVMDAGGALDFALAQFVTALRLGEPYPPQLAAIRSSSFTPALEMVQARSQSPLQSPQSPQSQPQEAVEDAVVQDAIN